LEKKKRGVPVKDTKSIIPDTKKLRDIVEEHCPQWSDYFKDVGVGALYMYNKRLTDISERDNAHLLWIICGNQLLRCHNGQTFCYSLAYGYWFHFNELLPQHIFEHIRVFGMVLEGMFRGMDGDVGRTDKEVLSAMNAVILKHTTEVELIRKMEMNCAWNTGNDKLRRGSRGLKRAAPGAAAVQPSQAQPDAAPAPAAPPAAVPASQPGVNIEVALQEVMQEDEVFGLSQLQSQAPRAAHHPGEEPREGAELELPPFTANNTWYILSAQAIGRCIVNLIRKLEANKAISFFNDWCETELHRTPGIAYKDAVFVYDRGDQNITHLSDRSPSDNIYLGINRTILDDVDPTLLCALAKLNTFLKQTFWAIPAALDFCMACQALARRGLNINNIALFWGPGGVGLSRYTAHLEAIYGSENSCTFDSNVFFEDGELRKQIIKMVGKVMYTCQEKPQWGEAAHAPGLG